jgi:DNA repair exonuclease SbcCD nuclease subunit
MKFYISSDYHADASTNGLDRFDEIKDAAYVVATAAIDSKNHGNDAAFIFAGDLCDPDTTRSFRAIGLAVEIALFLAKNSVPSLWVAGNHDVIENDRGSTVLEPLQMVADRNVSITVAESPRYWRFRESSVLALPYAARTNTYDPIEIVGRSPSLVPSLNLIVGHLTVPSAERGSESDDFARGRDMIFPVEECRKRWGDRCILVNGHYHRKQITKDGVHIPGSLARLRHDEEQHEPGYLVIEV